MPAEQVMERVADDAAHTIVPAAESPASQPAATIGRHEGVELNFSPDPQRRTDRYKLVTPYLLRL